LKSKNLAPIGGKFVLFAVDVLKGKIGHDLALVRLKLLRRRLRPNDRKQGDDAAKGKERSHLRMHLLKFFVPSILQRLSSTASSKPLLR
jgi:hypothetical protein